MNTPLWSYVVIIWWNWSVLCPERQGGKQNSLYIESSLSYRVHWNDTHCIFFVKFFVTMPPSSCFSSCFPGRKNKTSANKWVSHLNNLLSSTLCNILARSSIVSDCPHHLFKNIECMNTQGLFACFSVDPELMTLSSTHISFGLHSFPLLNPSSVPALGPLGGSQWTRTWRFF